MRIFLAGIMQGSHRGRGLHDQSYRERMVELIERRIPGAAVYDPFADHGDSVDYDDELGRQVFLTHNRMCGEVDAVIAFAPEASMGTAIEMWEAHRAGRVVIAVSPLATNWTVRFLSDRVYADLEAFFAALDSGEIAKILTQCGGCRGVEAPCEAPAIRV